MEKKSKVLIIGATGRLGYHLAKFSTEYCYPTFALIRDSSFNDPNKQQKLQSLSIAGVTFLKVSTPSFSALRLFPFFVILSFLSWVFTGFFFLISFFFKGSLEDEGSLMEAVKQVDVVICSIPSKQVLDQKLLIRVIKEAGCIKVINCR